MSFFAKSRSTVCNGNGNIIVGNSGNGTVIVNGKKYQGNNVSIIGNVVYIDGQRAEEVIEKDSEGNIIINIEGNVSKISDVASVTVNGDVDDIRDTSNVKVQGNVKEISDAANITVKGDVLGDISDCACVAR